MQQLRETWFEDRENTMRKPATELNGSWYRSVSVPVSIVSNKLQYTATPTFAVMHDRQLSQNSKSASHANIDKHVLCNVLAQFVLLSR